MAVDMMAETPESTIPATDEELLSAGLTSASSTPEPKEIFCISRGFV